MKRRVIIYLFLLIILFVILDYFGWLNQAVFVPEIRVMADSKGLFVDDEHKSCELDGDCVFIPYRCDNCGCGEPINKKYQKSYLSKLEDVCGNYRGLGCEPSICPKGNVKCIDKECYFVSDY